MNTQRISRPRGFTLIEVMVAMTVTAMIVTILVSITAIALDTWTRSRSEVRAARQAKSLVDTMGRDLESLVNRDGTKSEWLSAVVEPAAASGNSPGIESSNAAKLIFYTSPTDRYDGDLSNEESIGDVSCVGYELRYQDPIKAQGSKEIPTFVLYRLLVNPDDTFEKILAEANKTASSLNAKFDENFQSKMDQSENFVCENIFQYTITFNVTVKSESKGRTANIKNIPITLSNSGAASATEFRLEAGNIETDFVPSDMGIGVDQLKAGELTSVEISLTVLTDFGVEQMRNRKFQNTTEEAQFLSKNSYQYSKLIPVPSPQ